MTDAAPLAPAAPPRRIWVDADACPNTIKEVLYRAAERVGIELILIANQSLRVPPSRWIRSLQVPGGFDVADQAIVDRVQCGDLVITADIPLAADVLKRGAQALNPRGELYHADTIAQKLTMRDLMEELRGSGIQTGGPPPLHERDRRAFAAQLDRWLARARTG